MKRLTLFMVFIAAPAFAADFTYNPPGSLTGGSGTGRVDDKVYAPGMRYPIEVAPSYPNSQVWGAGGSQGGGGGQCDAKNYSYPWWDNYCESRSWDMPLCPSGTGHQGQDIRPSTCSNKTHWTVAAEDGTITSIGTYSVYLTTASGRVHRYLHMDPPTLAVTRGQKVTRGQRMGLVSNAFNGTPTTIHMHYDIMDDVSGLGQIFVPPYMSLVRSYEELIGQPAVACAIVPAAGGTLDNSGPCFTAFGNPTYWREVDGQGIENNFQWTNAWDGANPGNWGRWNINVEEAGEYEVSFNVVAGYNISKKVRYVVKHAGGEDTFIVDQSGVTDWHSLGKFTFETDGDNWVSVNDNTGETASDLHLTADALRLISTATAPTNNSPGTNNNPGTTNNNTGATNNGPGVIQNGTNTAIPTPTTNPGNEITASSSTSVSTSNGCSTGLGGLGMLGLFAVAGFRRRK